MQYGAKGRERGEETASLHLWITLKHDVWRDRERERERERARTWKASGIELLRCKLYIMNKFTHSRCIIHASLG